MIPWLRARVGERIRGPAGPDRQSAADERVIVGSVDEVVERIEQYRDALGMDLMVVRPAPGTEHRERVAALERLVSEVVPQLRPCRPSA